MRRNSLLDKCAIECRPRFPNTSSANSTNRREHLPPGHTKMNTTKPARSTRPLQDANIIGTTPLISPAELKREFPVSAAVEDHVGQSRAIVEDILSGNDKRVIAIVGPCSIHHQRPRGHRRSARQPDGARRPGGQLLLQRRRRHLGAMAAKRDQPCWSDQPDSHHSSHHHRHERIHLPGDRQRHRKFRHQIKVRGRLLPVVLRTPGR